MLEAVQRLRPDRRRGRADDGRRLALAWVLRRDELASAIIGASRPEQVHANAAASGIELSDDTLAAIDEALGDVVVTEPQLAGVRPRGRQAPLVTARAAAVAVALVAFAAAGAGSGAAAPDGGSRPDFRVLVYFEADSFHYSVGLGAGGRRRDRGARRAPLIRRRLAPEPDRLSLRGPAPLRRDRLRQPRRRGARRGPAGGVRALHPPRRWLRRHPRGDDGGGVLAVLRRAGGALFVSHPPIQAAALVVEDRDHPSTARLPRH